MDPSTDAERDPARCPLCEQPNACAAVSGASTCWCFTAQIPNEVLARIPEADRGQRCVCAACASGASPAASAQEPASNRT